MLAQAVEGVPASLDPPGAEPDPAVPPAVDRALVAPLRAEGGERGNASADATDRRAVPEVSVLRRPPDGASPAQRGRANWAPAGRSADAPDGSSGCLAGAADQRAAPRASGLPVSIAGLPIRRANHLWCADITYIPVQRGFLYLVGIMDWASRCVLAWRLSNTLHARFCADALDEALARHGAPEIFNTDQGSQFASLVFTARLQAGGIRVSMDVRGRDTR